MEGISIAVAGADLALTWREVEDYKAVLMFMLVDGEGDVLVPRNSTGIVLGHSGTFGMASASNGEHVFVAAAAMLDPTVEEAVPMVFLVDLGGIPIGDGVQIDEFDPEDRSHLATAVFREDDAYSVLYPGGTPEASGIVYRRFTVVD